MSNKEKKAYGTKLCSIYLISTLITVIFQYDYSFLIIYIPHFPNEVNVDLINGYRSDLLIHPLRFAFLGTSRDQSSDLHHIFQPESDL